MPTLGCSVDSQDRIELTLEGRRQATYVVGITGTGKTTLLLNIALQDISAGDGVCVMDPHGDVTEDLLLRIPKHRVDDVILFDPADIDYPFALNLFECSDRDDPRLVDRVCSEIVTTFYKLFYYSWGPHLEDLLRHSILTLLANEGSTLLDMLILLTQEDRREEMAARVADPVIQTYWRDRFPKRAKDQPEWVGSTLNKVGRFLSNQLIRNIVSQPRSTFDLRDIMDEGKILLVNLSKGKLGEDNSALLGSVLVGKILIAALSRADVPKEQRTPFHLIVDEYQSFATQSFPTLQSEARKFNIDTIVAHQYRDQLDELNRGSTLNVGNLIVFRVTGKDSHELAAQFDNTPPEPDLERQPMLYNTSREGVYRTADRGQYVLIPGKARLYSDVQAEMANRLTNLPNFQARCTLVESNGLVEYALETELPKADPDPGVAAYIRERSRKMALPRNQIEKAIQERMAKGAPPITFYD